MNLFITLEGNTTELEVQVVDANLNYNILLGSAYFVFLMKEKLSRSINCPSFLLAHLTTTFPTWEILRFLMRVLGQVSSKTLL